MLIIKSAEARRRSEKGFPGQDENQETKLVLIEEHPQRDFPKGVQPCFIIQGLKEKPVRLTTDAAHRMLIAQLVGVHFRGKVSACQHYLSLTRTFLGTPFVTDKRSSHVNLTQLLNYPKMSLAHSSLSVCRK